MPTRRFLMQATGASALFAQFGGFTAAAAAEDQPLFKFGVVADPQYAPAVPNLTLHRYYSNTLWKLSDAISILNKEDLAFVVTLGDIIDRSWESYQHILPLYDQVKAPNLFLLGNHDFAIAPEYLASVLRTTGLKAAHYDFTGGGYRFVVLDGNEISIFGSPVGSDNYKAGEARLAALKEKNAPNAQEWNGGLSDGQFAWLEATLARAQANGEKAIVMSHYPIYPLNLEDNLLDDARLVETLGRFPNVVAYMCGHHHAGNYGQTGGKHFVNFCGMVDTPDTTAFAVVEVYRDRIEIRGTGREPSRTLKI